MICYACDGDAEDTPEILLDGRHEYICEDCKAERNGWSDAVREEEEDGDLG